MDKRIVVYSQTDCAQCKMLKKQLERAMVSFEEINLDERPEERIRLKDEGYKSLPLTFLDGEYRFSGFNPTELRALLMEVG